MCLCMCIFEISVSVPLQNGEGLSNLPYGRFQIKGGKGKRAWREKEVKVYGGKINIKWWE